MKFTEKAQIVEQTSLQDLFKVDVHVNNTNLTAVLAHVVSSITAHAKYLDHLEANFVTRDYMEKEFAKLKYSIQQEYEEKANKLQEHVHQVIQEAQDCTKRLPILEKKFAAFQKQITQRIEEIVIESNSTIHEIEDEQTKLRQTLTKSMLDQKRDALLISMVLRILGIQEKELEHHLTHYDDINNTKFLFEHGQAFKALVQMIQSKVDQTQHQTILDQLNQTNHKIASMKEAIKQKLEKIIDDATTKKIDKRMDQMNQEFTAQLATKANAEETSMLLAEKISKKDWNDKVDHSYMVKLFDRFDMDITNRLKLIDEWSKQVIVQLDNKVDKAQVQDIANKVEIATKAEELSNTASVRFKCLCCGSMEPKWKRYVDQQVTSPPHSPPKLHNLDEHLTVLSKNDGSQTPAGLYTHRPSSIHSLPSKTTPKKKLRPVSANTHQKPEWKSNARATVSITGSDGRMYRGSLDSDYLAKMLAEQSKKQQETVIQKTDVERKLIKIPEQRLLSPMTETASPIIQELN